ncbi:MAG: hypothetical protein JNK57_04510 [Planctomycetaceae bacterium]|jgi:hypothetical protein|nr:hypothetical protein [Planctomycetaceae bacterium]
MKRDWMCGLAAKSLLGALSLMPATMVVAQEEIIETTEQRSATIVLSADQEGGQEGAPKEGIVVMSAESVDGGVPMVSGFSFNSADGNVFAIGGDDTSAFLTGPGGPGMFRLGADLPMMGAANNWGSLLNLPEVRKELDIMDAQMEQITNARNDMNKQIKETVSKMMEGGFDPSKAKEMSEIIKKQQAAIEEKISEQLLPAQVQRLKEVALRMQMRQVGTLGMLHRTDIKEALGLTDDQLKALEKKAEELDKEMKKRLEDLKKKAQADLLGELNPDQRKKLEEMMGKEFEYQAPERPRVIRRSSVSPTAPTPPAPPREPSSAAGSSNRFEFRTGGR